MLSLPRLRLRDDFTFQEPFCPDSFQQKDRSISSLSPIENRPVAAVGLTPFPSSALAFQSEMSGACFFNRCLEPGPSGRI